MLPTEQILECSFKEIVETYLWILSRLIWLCYMTLYEHVNYKSKHVCTCGWLRGSELFKLSDFLVVTIRVCEPRLSMLAG